MRGMGGNIARAQRDGMQQRGCGRAEGWGCRKPLKPRGVTPPVVYRLDIASLSVGECTKSTREKKGGNKSVSWGGETRAVSHEKTSLEGILKRSRGQTTWTKDMQGTRMRVTK